MEERKSHKHKCRINFDIISMMVYSLTLILVISRSNALQLLENGHHTACY